MSEDKDDKQFEPTEAKLRQAREKGDIPRSTEATAFLALLGSSLALLLLAPWLIRGWLTRAGDLGPTLRAPKGAVFAEAGALGAYAALALLGALLLPALVVLLGLVAQRGLLFTPSRLAPDIKRINPFLNAKQKFGPRGLTSYAISLLKVALVAAGAVWLARHLGGLIAASDFMRDRQWIAGLGVLLRQVLFLALAISAAVAGLDLFWRRFEYFRRQRMTRKEMEDDHKNSEGDPHFKSIRRQRAMDIALGTMLADVARADVVIVNPTHYAVALEWKRGSGRAPVCLAKGVDEIAARIREAAAEASVPIWSDPPCARALHAAMNIGDEIPGAQFAAVAAAIRFAEAMRAKARAGW